MRRAGAVMRGVTAALLVLLLGAAPARADSTGADTFVVTYDATTSIVTTDPDGVSSTRVGDGGAVTLTCTTEQCTVTAAPFQPYFANAVILPDGSSSTAAGGDSASVCVRGYSLGTMTASATATGFSATFEAPSPGWEQCAEGRQYRHAMVITWATGAATGDVCIFEDLRCGPTPAPEPAATIIAAPIDPEPALASSGSFLATGDPAAPSVLSALPVPAEAGTAPSQLLVAALLTVILALLVAFPTALLNSAVDAGSERLAAWRAARRGAGSVRAAPRAWWWAAAGVVAASVVSAFVDPQFGFNAGSGRVLLSILASFAIDVVLGWTLTVWLMRRVVPGVSHSYLFRPLTLLVVIAAVVFTRVTGFEPGIVFGLVAGVAFGAIVGRSGEARAALTTVGYAFAVAFVAWIAYGALGGGAGAGESFWGTFVIETLSAVAIGGMAALPIALVPLRGLAGHAIWAWKRWVWAVAYAVGLLAFFIVLLPMPFSWEEVSLTLGSWVGLYVVYAVVAVAFWLFVARPWQGETQSDVTEASEPEEASTSAARVDE